MERVGTWWILELPLWGLIALAGFFISKSNQYCPTVPVTDAATYSTLQHRPLRSVPRDCSHSPHTCTLYIRPVKIVPALKKSTKTDFEHSRALKFLSTKSALTWQKLSTDVNFRPTQAGWLLDGCHYSGPVVWLMQELPMICQGHVHLRGGWIARVPDILYHASFGHCCCSTPLPKCGCSSISSRRNTWRGRKPDCICKGRKAFNQASRTSCRSLTATSTMSCEPSSASGQREWRAPWQRRNCSLPCRQWSSSRCFHAWMTTPTHDWPRRGGVVEAPQAEPTTLVVCCTQFSFGSAIKCSRASVLHSSLTLWRPPSWSTWGLFGGRRDACIQLSWLTYCTPVWCADGHTCAGCSQPLPLPLPVLLLCFVNRHTCTYKLTHTCAKPHWYRHILIHVTICLDINSYLPFTVQYVLAMTIYHLRQTNLIKYTSDQKFISWCASTVEHYFIFWALNGH